MTCRLMTSLLERYLDGELPHTEAVEVETHIRDCAECQKRYDDLVRLKECLKSYSVPDPGREYFNNTTDIVMARVAGSGEHRRSESNDQAQRRRALYRSIAAAAASLAILISALTLGTNDSSIVGFGQNEGAPPLTTASLRSVLEEEDAVLTGSDRDRLARAAIMLGSPGLPGRVTTTHHLWGQP
jgi:anti-sigma factor RsiW